MHIENEAAYERGKERNIRMNARKGRANRWHAANDDAQRIEDFLNGFGDFADTKVVDDDGEWVSSKPHPHRQVSFGSFFSNMADSLSEWGSLTDGQTKAVRGMMESAAEKIAEREKALSEKADRSDWIGEEKERREFEAEIKHIHSFESQWGFCRISIMECEGKELIYKGGLHLGEKGDTVRFTATIKKHDVRNGVKQTIVNRPKVD